MYPIVKRVAGYLEVSMTKKLFASGLARAIPFLGASLSGSLTLATFYPMSKRLQRHLASLELTKPGHRGDEAKITDDVVTLVIVEDDAELSESTERDDAELNAMKKVDGASV